MGYSFNPMEYSFNTDEAAEYGDRGAILIRHFRFWIMYNKTHNKNNNDGHTWTYITLDQLSKTFYFYSRMQIQRAVEKLIKDGVLIKGNYNKAGYDRTVWYAFKNEVKMLGSNHISKSIYEMDNHISISKSPYIDSVTTIPVNNILNNIIPSTNTEFYTPMSRKRDEKMTVVKKIFDYWKDKCNHPRSKYNEERKRQIQKAFKLGFSERDILDAIEGVGYDPWCSGSNPGTKRHDDIEFILRTTANIERFIEAKRVNHIKPPKTDQVFSFARKLGGERDVEKIQKYDALKGKSEKSAKRFIKSILLVLHDCADEAGGNYSFQKMDDKFAFKIFERHWLKEVARHKREASNLIGEQNNGQDSPLKAVGESPRVV